MIKSVFQTLSRNQKITVNQTRNAAVTAGLALLGMAILSPIAHSGILNNLPQESLYTTLENITNLKMEVVLAIIILTIIVILDGVVAVALIQFLRPSKQRLIVLMGWTRIIYAGVYLLAIGFLVAMVLRVGDASSVVSPQALSDLKGFHVFWDIALVIFGVHLIILGWLFYKASYTPYWLGAYMIIVGLNYIVDSFGTYLIDDYNPGISTTAAFIIESILIIWLLIWGRKLTSSDLKIKK